MKYIIVTGGVVSGLGKGITISSIGRILKSSNVRVTAIKIDPYLNVDAGTMSPFEHGETFVLDDGGETDLDLGNYERFLDITLTARHNITTGKIYKEVIKRERRGDYLGKTVQMVPHATDMVQSWIKEVSKISVDGTGLCPDVCLIEVGGTVGDIESMVFLEALRQFQFAVGRENTMFVHVSLLPVVGSAGSGEQKTKPTQHSVKELRSLGLSPDLIVCRSTGKIDAGTKAKISTFCHVPQTHVLSVHDVSNIYHVPLILVEQNIHSLIKQQLQLPTMTDMPILAQWESMATVVDNPTLSVSIAIVGKYTVQQQGGDAYLSVAKAIKHASIHMKIEVSIQWVEATLLEEEAKIKQTEAYDKAWATLRSVHGILIPGGFGVRGVEGKVAACKFARENKVPFLGICLGLQVMVIEYCRHVLGISGAHSAEFNKADKTGTDTVVVFMPEISQTEMGGTMRLGARPTVVASQLPASASSSLPSLAGEVYGLVRGRVDPSSSSSSASPVSSVEGTDARIPFDRLSPEYRPGFAASGSVMERHRHRYEINPDTVARIEEQGLFFTGKDESGTRMEIAELPRSKHPFYFAVQFHPEFKSRPNRPSPPFFAFVAMAKTHQEQKMKVEAEGSVAEGEAEAVDRDFSMADIDGAGQLWQSHLSDVKKEIALIYSPKSSRKRTRLVGDK